ncbi:hypothetical protein HPB48_000888 [Haemaphysalis longicornis]|uniref:Sodium-dependent multivitamin transporter n=1 Tax=Haemaphysalis longicornis TaxID=44386 RepID=A0A9J6GV00_HAELO|nr:hypothetical protein HPB48_000888 [Haemaphysalis longicornis]
MTMAEVLEYVVFCIVIIANLSTGLYVSFRRDSLRRGTTSNEAEVFLGSRALRVLPLAASSAASLFSSIGLIGFPAHVYTYGMHSAWTLVTPVLYLPLATYVIVPLIYKMGFTSIFEVSGKYGYVSFFLIAAAIQAL